MEKLKEEVKDIKRQLAENAIYTKSLEDRIITLEEGESFTGVYLDGSPEYVKNYINKTEEK